jgi:DNA gyrase subunit A
LGDQAKIVNAITTDERFTPAHHKPATKHDPAGPYLLVITAGGMSLRTPLAPYRIESTKAGRRYARLDEGDRVVLATVWRGEENIFLASAEGRVLHFPVAEINILSGVGKGVIGIKLDKDDRCLGGALIGSRFDALVVETSGGVRKEYKRGAHPPTGRGGKGYEVVKRAGLVRVVPPPIELVDWDKVEGGNGQGKHEKNGHGGKGLFD